jgi:hypothetical protein
MRRVNMTKTAFPKEIYVSWGEDDPGREDRFLNAAETEYAAINDDGPSSVATYQLVEVRNLDKIVKVIGARKK